MCLVPGEANAEELNLKVPAAHAAVILGAGLVDQITCSLQQACFATDRLLEENGPAALKKYDTTGAFLSYVEALSGLLDAGNEKFLAYAEIADKNRTIVEKGGSPNGVWQIPVADFQALDALDRAPRNIFKRHVSAPKVARTKTPSASKSKGTPIRRNK